MPNRAASRLVLKPYSEAVVIEEARALLHEVGGEVSCAFVFASGDYQPHLADFLELLQVHGHVPLIAGGSGSGLIGTGVEEEAATGFSMLFLHLPNTKIRSFAVEAELEAEGPAAWHHATGVRVGEVATWMLIGNPATLSIEDWLAEWNAAYPGVPCLGGLASAGPDQEMFVFQDHRLVGSAVLLGFQGGIEVQGIVSQGCRPVGEPFTITAANDNIVLALGSRPAYERLTETFKGLSPGDRAHAAGNLFAGLAMSEYMEEFKTGDFLVRNLIGGDPQSGALVVGALPRVGQTLQFQLRDRRSANEDLQRILLEKSRTGTKPFAALIFSCNGRGRRLFGVQNHDAAALESHLGRMPAAGFFCNGEIGPVGGRNYVHGYTVAMALFVTA